MGINPSRSRYALETLPPLFGAAGAGANEVVSDANGRKQPNGIRYPEGDPISINLDVLRSTIQWMDLEFLADGT